MTIFTTTFRSGTRVATSLVALVLAAAGGATAQTTADSSGRATPQSDSSRAYVPSPAYGDSTAGAPDSGRSSGDTSSRSAAGGDSAAAAPAPDTAGASSVGIRPPSSGAGPVVTVLAPPDTTLTRACAGAEAGSEAPGLLAVVFRAGTTDKERAAAARAVGGTLAGPNGFGEEYVRVPASAGALAAVADRLIRQDPVTRVSPAPCPGPMPRPVTSPTAPTSDSGVKPGATGASQGGVTDSTKGAVPDSAKRSVPAATGDTAHKAPTMSP